MTTKFSPGELVEIKSADEMSQFESLHGRGSICGWTGSMFALCGKQFRITSVEEEEEGQKVYGHNTGWHISSDMIKRVDEPFKKGDTVRVKSLEQIHEIISDGNNRYWTDSKYMRELCGVMIKLDYISGDFVVINRYGVHKDFLERVPTIDISAPVPRFATADGTVYTDRCTDGAPMRKAELHDDVGDPAPEKQKSRIQFSKIR